MMNLGLGAGGGDPLVAAHDSKVAQLILSDPEVQAAILKDPQGALQSNAKLQQAVMEDPQMQAYVKNNAGNMAQDPRVQAFLKQKAKEAGAELLKNVRSSAAKGMDAFKKYVQAGPAGIQMLCFITGGFTFVVGLLGIINLFSMFETPFTFVMNLYVVSFGAITIIVEADDERMKHTPILEYVAPKVEQLQGYLNEEAKFLTLLWGRGFFYVFIGLLMGTQCWVCLFFIAGAANITMGVLCLLTHFGVEVDIDYMQDMAGDAYDRISSMSDADAAQFGRAAEAWAKSSLSSDKACKALHAQATEGDVQGERPSGFFDASAKAEYDAKKALVGMSKTEAKREFVARCKAKGVKW
eukprot:g8161.t1